MTSWPCYDPESLCLLLSLARLKQPRALFFLLLSFRDPMQIILHFLPSSSLRQMEKMFSKVKLGLPWWLSGKDSACQFRRHRFHRHMPWRGWTHGPERLGLCTLEPMHCNKRSHHNEKPVRHNRRVAPAQHN